MPEFEQSFLHCTGNFRHFLAHEVPIPFLLGRTLFGGANGGTLEDLAAVVKESQRIFAHESELAVVQRVDLHALFRDCGDIACGVERAPLSACEQGAGASRQNDGVLFFGAERGDRKRADEERSRLFHRREHVALIEFFEKVGDDLAVRLRGKDLPAGKAVRL